MFAFKKFQRDDYTRAALAPSLILAHDTGLGKTLAAYTIPLLWLGWTRAAGPALTPAKPVLLVAPGDLHENFAAEGREKFRTACVRLPDQQALLDRVTRDATGTPALPPAFYLTSYHELAMNGRRPFPEPGARDPRGFLAEWGWREALADPWFAARGERHKADYQRLGATPEMSLGELQAAARKAEAALPETAGNREWVERQKGALALSLARLELFHGPVAGLRRDQLTAAQQAGILRGWLADWLAECRQGVDEQRTHATGHTITCVHSPALVDLCGGLFAAAVVDEGVRVKGDDTLIGQGLRRLNPPHRLVLTGTPIKNRLPDLFWLAQWVGGMAGANARWPYEPTPEAKEEFIAEFMVTESNLTQAKNAGSVLNARHKGKVRAVPKRFQKVTPECCNLHRLWKLVAPVLLRRRKDDLGEDIVKKAFHQLDVPLGATHAAVYKYHLEARYVSVDSRGRETRNVAAQMMALRQASACPHTANLLPQAGGQGGPYRAAHEWTPKLMVCLTLLRDQLRRGRQGAVFSAFREPLAALGRRLDEAGVRHALLNGDTGPAARGRLSRRFQHGRGPGDLPVVLCGIESTAEGHNWPNAGYVVRYDLAQALDKNVQSVNRAHRLTSPADVDVYDLVNRGTIDLRLRELCQKKGDTSDLVLDGRLMGEARAELNLRELLDHAAAVFDAAGTIPEARLAAQWPQLREELRQAQRDWDRGVTDRGARPASEGAPAAFPLATRNLPPVTPPKRGLGWLARLKPVNR